EVVYRDDFTDEFVTGRHQQVDIGRYGPVAPVHGSPVEAFEVAGADADSLHLDQSLAGSGNRHGNPLESVVLAAVNDHGLHGRTHSTLLVSCRLGSIVVLIVTPVWIALAENRVPSFWTAAAPHCKAVTNASLRSCGQLRKPASMASPAPTVLITLCTGARPHTAPVSSTRIAPSAPRLANTVRAPRRHTSWADSTTSPRVRGTRPVSSASSCTFGFTRSGCAERLSASACPH